jgi:mono/diheme cytochrome c family protein
MLPNIASTDATYDAGQYPIYEPELAAGDGRQEVETHCDTCHSPRYITMQPPLPAGAWADEVNKMVKMYGASVPGDDAQKIIGYLQSHYTPETRKR